MPYRDFQATLRKRLDRLYQQRVDLDAEIRHAEAVLQLSRGAQMRGQISTLIWAIAVAVTVGIGFVGLAYAVQPTCAGNPFGRTRTDAQNIVSALQLYWMDHPDGPCPTTETLEGEYVDKTEPLIDGWGQRFLLVCVDKTVVVISAGSDGEYGTGDDLRWELSAGPQPVRLPR